MMGVNNIHVIKDFIRWNKDQDEALHNLMLASIYMLEV